MVVPVPQTVSRSQSGGGAGTGGGGVELPVGTHAPKPESNCVPRPQKSSAEHGCAVHLPFTSSVFLPQTLLNSHSEVEGTGVGGGLGLPDGKQLPEAASKKVPLPQNELGFSAGGHGGGGGSGSVTGGDGVGADAAAGSMLENTPTVTRPDAAAASAAALALSSAAQVASVHVTTIE